MFKTVKGKLTFFYLNDNKITKYIHFFKIFFNTISAIICLSTILLQ